MENSSNVKIVVIGVGGGGSNAVNNMVNSADGSQVKFVVVNTDGQDIEKSVAQSKVLLTTKNKKNEGLGAGAKPEVGADAAENSLEFIREHLEGADMCFIAAGLGGGTGTGAAPVIARYAKEELDITTVAVVTRPFGWEGRKRALNAKEGLAKLHEATDALIEIPNDRIVSMADKKTSLKDAFKEADNVLKDGVLGITDLITKTGLINLDFADVQAIVKDAGVAHMGIGTYKSTGDDSNGVLKALLRAIESPLLETNIKGAKRIMINYVSSEDLSMLDISEANEMIYDLVDADVNLIWGNATDASMQEGEVKVTVIAAEFNKAESENQKVKIETPKAQPVGGLMGQELNNSFANNINNMAGNNTSYTSFADAPREFSAEKFKSMFGKNN